MSREAVASLVLAMSIGAALLGCKRSSANDGPSLFRSACARCHGADGTGGPPVRWGGPSPRNFHDHAFQASHTDAQIRDVIVHGKGGAMPAFRDTFTDAQLAALVAQVRSFDRDGGGR